MFPLKESLKKLNRKFQLLSYQSTADENIKHFLKLDNYDSLFKNIFGATKHKSKIKKFEMIFKYYNLKSSECIFVTDTVGDIIDAKKVNVKTIAVSWGFHDAAILSREKPLAIVNNENELFEQIKQYS